MIQKGLQYFIYTLAAVLPWQTVYLVREIFVEGEKWQYGAIGIYASDLIILSIIALAGWAYRAKAVVWIAAQMRAPSITTVLVSTLCIYLYASTLWSGDPMITMVYALRVMSGVLLVLCLRAAQPDRKKLGAVLAGSVLLSALLAMGQFTMQEDFASTALGLSKHNVYEGGVSVIESDGGRWLRAYGSFTHPNMLGAIMAMMIVLVSGALFIGRESVLWRALQLIILAVSFAALLVSFSRSALVGLILGMTALVALYSSHHRHDGVSARALGPILLMLLAIGTIFYISYDNLWQTRVQGEARLERLSVQERTSQVAQAFHVIQDNLLLGVGAGTYTKRIAESDTYRQPIWKYQPVHNTPLLLIAEIGLIGMILIAALAGITSVRIYRHFDQHSDEESAIRSAIVAALLVFATTAFFDHWHWDNHMGIPILALCVGLLRSREACAKKSSV